MEVKLAKLLNPRDMDSTSTNSTTANATEQAEKVRRIVESVKNTPALEILPVQGCLNDPDKPEVEEVKEQSISVCLYHKIIFTDDDQTMQHMNENVETCYTQVQKCHEGGMDEAKQRLA